MLSVDEVIFANEFKNDLIKAVEDSPEEERELHEDALLAVDTVSKVSKYQGWMYGLATGVVMSAVISYIRK